MKRLILALGLTALFAVPALAEDQYPIFSMQRATLGARLEYVWHTGDNAQPLSFKKEWAAGPVFAYSIVPKLTISSRYLYHFDSKINDFAVGLNLKLIGPK